jgi:hypothetical protein
MITRYARYQVYQSDYQHRWSAHANNNVKQDNTERCGLFREWSDDKWIITAKAGM